MLDFRGGEALAEGNSAAAADYFDKALALSPDSPSLRHRFATSLWRMGDQRGAEAAFEEIIRTAPEYTEARFNLAMIMAGSGRTDEAIAQLAAALERKPGYVEARLNLARILARNGRPDEARERVRDAARDGAPECRRRTRIRDEPRAPGALRGGARPVDGRDARLPRSPGVHARPRPPARGRARRVALRDPRRALALAEELLDRPQQSAQDSLAVGETYAMALAGVGQYGAAAAVQRDVRAQAASFGDIARSPGGEPQAVRAPGAPPGGPGRRMRSRDRREATEARF